MSLMTGFFTVTSLFVAYAFWFYYKYVRVFYENLKKYPGPKPNIVIGNILEFATSTEILNRILKRQYEYGSVYKLSLGMIRPTRFSLVVTDTKMLEFLLSSQNILKKSINYRFLHKWLQFGLLTSDGNKWKQRRRIITPTFHFQILEQFVQIFNSAGEILINKLEKEDEKVSVNIYPYITLCALDIICESAMGVSVGAQNYSESEYVFSVKEMCRIMMERSSSIIKMNDFFYLLTRDYYKERKAVKVLHDYTDNVIYARKNDLKVNKNLKNEDEEKMGIKKKLTFLDLLLQSTVDGKPLSHTDIREEVDTFMFEGHDTTASGISFALYCIANHPDVQQKIVEELNTIFDSDKTRPATYKDLQEMKYMELVIKETLRLYPSVPFFARELDQDMKYEDIILPAGLTLFVFAYGIHRDPKIYPEPEKFDPERFRLENCVGRSPFAYIPFSAGPRNCIGQKFAMLEIKCTISKILRNFELFPATPDHHLKLAAEAVLKSANGVRIRLKRRQ